MRKVSKEQQERNAMRKEEANTRLYRIKTRPKFILSPLILPSNLKPKTRVMPRPRTRTMMKHRIVPSRIVPNMAPRPRVSVN